MSNQNVLMQKLQYKQPPRHTLREGVHVAIAKQLRPTGEIREPGPEPVAALPSSLSSLVVSPAIRIVDKRHAGFQRDVVLHRLYQRDAQRQAQRLGPGPDVLSRATFEEETPTTARAIPKTGKIAKVVIQSVEKAAMEPEVEKEVEPESAQEKATAMETEAPKPAEKKVETSKPTKRTTKKIRIVPTSASAAPSQEITMLSEATLKGRLPPPPPESEQMRVSLRTSKYYLNNRKKFIQQVNALMRPYKATEKAEETATEDMSCSKSASSSAQTRMMIHQKVVRDYLNLYSPYRGLLLYHGLGSGKTCTSIAIAEGLKTQKRIIVMTPASLETNFWEQLKQCGDDLYKKNQYWEFVSVEGKPDYRETFHTLLQLPMDFIDKQRGVWMVDASKPANFGELATEAKQQVDAQLDAMIRTKYTNIHYNGLTRAKMDVMTRGGTVNPFDHTVVIVDEAHNLVSRIVNKLPKGGSAAPKKTAAAAKKAAAAEPIGMLIYQYLMSAVDAKVVLLTGTPIVNYPNEVGVLYNMLRGYIQTWSWTLMIGTQEKVTTESIKAMLNRGGLGTYDYVNYSGNQLTVTRNPYGFVHSVPTDKGQKKKGGTRKQKAPKGRRTRRKNGSKEQKRLPSFLPSRPDSFVPTDADNAADHTYHLEAHMQYVGENEPHKGGNGKGDVVPYEGVYLDDTGNMSDKAFTDAVKRILKQNGIETQGNIRSETHKCLPDNRDVFLQTFVETSTGFLKQQDLFQRRIVGLTSYFPNTSESLMPAFVLNDKGEPIHTVRVPMSEYQFGLYEKIRHDEEATEKNVRKAQRQLAKKGSERKAVDEDMFTMASSYRIFSRAVCNFAFPDPPGRPMPTKKTDVAESEDVDVDIDEDEFNATPPAEVRETSSSAITDVAEEYQAPTEDYTQRIQRAMDTINTDEYLTGAGLQRYSPKFAAMLANLQDDAHRGLHLIYSNFRTIEGIGIARLILLCNGFAEFKLKKTAQGEWDMDDSGEAVDVGKPRFVLYTGTETTEEKEIIRNVYNGAWDQLPTALAAKLRERAPNNQYGEIIKVFMITASGAEGINLKNTRYVHLVEPYWHMVRMEQVIGRARRICSHESLPEDMRTVQVWLYLSVLSERQKTDEKYIELRNRDVSRLDASQVITTDESLFEMAAIKQRINGNLLRTMQATAVDCGIYPQGEAGAKAGAEPPVVCYTLGRVQSDQFVSNPDINRDAMEQTTTDVVKRVELKLKSVSIKGKKHDLDETTMELYDHDDVMRAKKDPSVALIPLGRLVKEGRSYRIDPL